ncbi:hypothetical protein [Falsiroseomonas sp. E2-1-a20]|uniref:hypothetical protein n=1 Tax=Falsiroseomonas sp. E2-1-a20 TaxID=3239300 RepID=UPI003F2C672A
MPDRARIALVVLVLAVPLVPLVGGLAAAGTVRDLVLIGLVAVVAGAFVFVLAGDPARQARRTTPQAARSVAVTLGSAGALGLGLILFVLWLRAAPGAGIGWDRHVLAQYGSVAFFAGAVGFGELIARYRDDPSSLLGMRPSAAYICINVASGIIALALVQQFQVIDAANPNRLLVETLLAAFGAIAFFRTSLFTARIGDADVGIGPSTMLKTFLEGSDRLVNRSQATDRADTVARCMRDIDFEKAKATLPAFCLGLVEGLSGEEQRELGEQIARLDQDAKITPAAKTHILGVYLLRQVGGTVLAKAVQTLGDTIRSTGPQLVEPMDVPE